MQSSAYVTHFLGVMPDGMGGLEWKLRVLRNRIPKNLLPIGAEGTGGVVCISLYGDDTGKVYFWDAGHEEDINEGDEPDYYNVWWIADNFNDFLNSLSDV
jgi:hypothetical protein